MFGAGLLCLALFVPSLYGWECGFDDRLLEVNKTVGTERSGWMEDEENFFDWSEYKQWRTGQIHVPYYFKRPVPNKVRKAVRAGLEYVEKHMSCIRFVERNKNTNKRQLEIEIAKPDFCKWGQLSGGVSTPKKWVCIDRWSCIRKWTKRIHLSMSKAPCLQPDSWAKDSIKKFSVWYQVFVHEVFHAFGIGHTMRRMDRDDYITVFTDNIPDNWQSQYAKVDFIPLQPGRDKIPYECNSIMHYRPKTYKGFSGPNFRAINPRTCKFNKKEPTDNDWKALKYKVCPTF